MEVVVLVVVAALLAMGIVVVLVDTGLASLVFGGFGYVVLVGESRRIRLVRDRTASSVGGPLVDATGIRMASMGYWMGLLSRLGLIYLEFAVLFVFFNVPRVECSRECVVVE